MKLRGAALAFVKMAVDEEKTASVDDLRNSEFVMYVCPTAF